MSKLAIVTGATAGIGESTARKLAGIGFDLVLTGRRQERLERLKQQIENDYNIKVQLLCFDIRDKKEVETAIEKIEKIEELEILINNAGLASGLSPIHEGDNDDWEKMIDTNIKGLLYISRKIMPYMVKNKKGHIVNIGSVAGREVYPNGNVYCATKHAVDALSKAMRIDLLPHGIRVTQIAPGAVETEFSIVRFHGDEGKAKAVYNGFDPLLAEDIADAVIYAVTRPAHVNINDMLIMPTAQATATNIDRK
ncbi:MAG: SDR family NAD(P)-dependent oxidoreductase [Bacteroidales bacterium]|nr:SDR family NAD(P)-dependent oxidoreductase [Bacteroidales bacterium]